MRAAITRLRNRGEGGFTLAELLVALTIQGLIMGALAMAFVGILRGSTQVNQSLNKTGDARIAAQYIVSDARNSSGPELSLTDTSSCPDPSPPVAGTASPVVRFNWDNTNSGGASVANIVNYVKVGNSLLRRQCVNGALVSDRAVASSVQNVNVTCSPTTDCSGTPTSITITVTSTPDADGTSYSYTLTTTFRKLIGDGPPVNPKSIILLGSPGDCSLGATGIRVSGSGNLRIYGDAYVNTTDGSTCKAMNISNSGVFKAGNTKILTGGSCTASGSSVCPTTTSYSPAVTDPYASLTAPSTAGLPAQSGCAGGTAQPGVYAAALSLTGVATCQLASGVYIFQNGLSLGNSSVLTSAAGGVLIYITGGSFSVGGASSINVSAQTSGQYVGLVIWQASSDSNTVAFSNGGSITLNGALYAPSAQVSLTGAASNPYVTSIVAKTIFVGNSGVIVIGSPSVTPLSITTTSPLQAWTVNRAGYSVTLAGDGGDGIYTWSATGLPAGLSINSSTGVISGTPTATGTSTVSVTLSDQLGDNPVTKSLSITINAAPSISTPSLPNGSIGTSYSTTMAASGGASPLAWSATGLPSGLSINSSSGTISGTPSASGTSSVNVTVTDASGATDTNPYSLTVNSPPTISSVTLTNGTGTAGTMDKADTITVVFSAQMKVSSFCSAWSNDANNQSISGNNQVTVSVSNGTGGTNDVVTVTSTTCTFNFGSINLGSNAYVSAATTFKGTSSNKSTITWTASTRTLVITLGAKSTGTVANVSSSAPVCTASGSIQDSSGASLSNSPCTLPAGTKF